MLNDCPEDFKPVNCIRFADDIFALFGLPDHFEKFRNYLNSKYKNIKFSYEKKVTIHCLFLIDILISRSKNGFKSSVYHKTTSSGVYSNFISLIYNQYKIGLLFTFLFQAFSVVSDFPRFYREISHLKKILRKNTVSIKLVDNCIKTFLNNKFLHTPVALPVEKKELLIILPSLFFSFSIFFIHNDKCKNTNSVVILSTTFLQYYIITQL